MGASDDETAAPQADHELKTNPAHPASIQGSDSGRAQGEAAGEGSPSTEENIEDTEQEMTTTISQLQELPDNTGCKHSHAGIDGPSPHPWGNMEVAFCTDCNHQIGFVLNEAGKRTGETKIIQKVVDETPKAADKGGPNESGS